MNFTFTEQEADVILHALAKQPFETVYLVIAKLQKQAIEQLKEKTEENKE